MIYLTEQQRDRLYNASSKSGLANRENLDKVIEELMLRSPWAFGEKALKDLRRRINMSRHHGYAKIE